MIFKNMQHCTGFFVRLFCLKLTIAKSKSLTEEGPHYDKERS